MLSSLTAFVVAARILCNGTEARRAHDDEDRPQVIIAAAYSGPFTTNIVVRNIGHGTIMKSITQRTAGSAGRPKRREPSRADDLTNH